MFEKVNPMHPDKLADRIGGTLVDYAYRQENDPRIAVEVLIGHGHCHIIAETSVKIPLRFVKNTVKRIAGDGIEVDYLEVPQDQHLAANQKDKLRCGDNGIFKGMPVTEEQRELTRIAKEIYEKHPTDGKYILADGKLTICQSCASTDELESEYPGAIVNPLGDWTGGIEVDSGLTNRKLGSDMGDSVTGGGPNSKDLSKADVSVNIYAWLKAQETGEPIELHCSIGDEEVGGIPYEEIVETARGYIDYIGGFERFAEWGLIR